MAEEYRGLVYNTPDFGLANCAALSRTRLPILSALLKSQGRNARCHRLAAWCFRRPSREWRKLAMGLSLCCTARFYAAGSWHVRWAFAPVLSAPGGYGAYDEAFVRRGKLNLLVLS